MRGQAAHSAALQLRRRRRENAASRKPYGCMRYVRRSSWPGRLLHELAAGKSASAFRVLSANSSLLSPPHCNTQRSASIVQRPPCFRPALPACCSLLFSLLPCFKRRIVRISQLLFPPLPHLAKAGPIVQLHSVQRKQEVLVELRLQFAREPFIAAAKSRAHNAHLTQCLILFHNGAKSRVNPVQSVINPGFFGNVSYSHVCLLVRRIWSGARFRALHGRAPSFLTALKFFVADHVTICNEKRAKNAKNEFCEAFDLNCEAATPALSARTSSSSHHLPLIAHDLTAIIASA